MGSSGIEYALTNWWRTRGSCQDRELPSFPGVDQILVVTGSCSPVTARQIEYAGAQGFQLIDIRTDELLLPRTRSAAITNAVDSSLAALRIGKSVILHSSLGPLDPRVQRVKNVLTALGLDAQAIREQSGQQIGPHLGQILKQILNEFSLPRIAIAGGDSSGFIAQELEIEAVEAVAYVAPGSPLCKAHAKNALHGIELLFKGGQVGRDDLWITVRDGTQEPKIT